MSWPRYPGLFSRFGQRKEHEVNINWRDAFRRYSDLVGEYEGTSFLYERDWTPEEWEAIMEAIMESWDEA